MDWLISLVGCRAAEVSLGFSTEGGEMAVNGVKVHRFFRESYREGKVELRERGQWCQHSPEVRGRRGLPMKASFEVLWPDFLAVWCLPPQCR